jgi:hypothetical protein
MIMAVYILLHFIPFGWFVDITKYDARDTCVGSDVVVYETKRVPRWGILGQSYSQIVRFEDQAIIETTITRGTVSSPTQFGYEAGTTEAVYESRWSEPFLNPGVYGANEWLTIYPIPFIGIKRFNNAKDTKFNVVECN